MDPIAQNLMTKSPVPRTETACAKSEKIAQVFVQVQADDHVRIHDTAAPLLSDPQIQKVVHKALFPLPESMQNKIFQTAQLSQWKEHAVTLTDTVRLAQSIDKAPEADDTLARFNEIDQVVNSSKTKLAVALCISKAAEKLPRDKKWESFNKLITRTEDELRAEPESSYAIIALANQMRDRSDFDRLHVLSREINHDLYRMNAFAALTKFAPQDVLPEFDQQLDAIPKKHKHIANILRDALFFRRRDGSQ